MEVTPFEMRMMERLAKKLDIWEYTKNFTPEDSRYFFNEIYDIMDEDDFDNLDLDFFIVWQFTPWVCGFTLEQLKRYIEFAAKYFTDIPYLRDIEKSYIETIKINQCHFVQYLRLAQGKLWTWTFKNKKTQRLVFETEKEVPSKYLFNSKVTVKAIKPKSKTVVSKK